MSILPKGYDAEEVDQLWQEHKEATVRRHVEAKLNGDCPECDALTAHRDTFEHGAYVQHWRCGCALRRTRAARIEVVYGCPTKFVAQLEEDEEHIDDKAAELADDYMKELGVEEDY